MGIKKKNYLKSRQDLSRNLVKAQEIVLTITFMREIYTDNQQKRHQATGTLCRLQEPGSNEVRLCSSATRGERNDMPKGCNEVLRCLVGNREKKGNHAGMSIRVWNGLLSCTEKRNELLDNTSANK